MDWHKLIVLLNAFQNTYYTILNYLSGNAGANSLFYQWQYHLLLRLLKATLT